MDLISKKAQKLVIAVSKRKDGSMRSPSLKLRRTESGRDRKVNKDKQGLSDEASQEAKSGRFLGDVQERLETRKNRRDFLRKLGVKPEQVVSAGLVYGSHIAVVDREDAGRHIPKTDGLLTQSKGLFLALTVADCLPVFLFDPEKEVVGLIHCGWRPLAKEILIKACAKMSEEFGTNLEEVLAGIGPGICQKHYEVKSDVGVRFAKCKDCIKEKNKKLYLDLRGVAKTQLQACGVRSSNIQISAECTYELKDRYFSYRRSGKPIKTMLAVFGRKGE